MTALAVQSFCLLLAHFVCPLVFFTNFTRNPYQTQITLLHLCLVALVLAQIYGWARRSSAPPDSPAGPKAAALDGGPAGVLSRIFWPLGVFTLVCWLSWLHSWFSHPPFFRSSVAAEGLRVNVFWVVNILLAIVAGSVVGRRVRQEPGTRGLWEPDLPSLGAGLLFGAGWLFYQRLRIPNPPSNHSYIWAFLWDPYGFFLWFGALAFLAYRWRRIGPRLLITINLTVGMLAGIYAIGQYFGVDLIWPRNMSPYGSRAISTFGNPNFLSPYLAVLMPGLLVGSMKSKLIWQRCFYCALWILFAAALLATQTRSSWAAALVGSLVSVWLLRPGRAGRSGEPAGSGRSLAIGLGVGAVLLFLAWPGRPKSGTPSALGRLVEMKSIWQESKTNSKDFYQPFFQRMLIWSGCWRFVKERPLLGKGWGTIELFYPFYQSNFLFQPRYEKLRTHANNGHNEVIEVWSQTGILGMGIFLWFFAVFFAWALRNLPSLGENNRVFAIGLLGGSAGMLADNALNVSLHFSMPGYLFWWSVGLLAGLYPDPPPGHFNEAVGLRNFFFRSPLLRRAAAGILAVTLICAGVFASRFWLSEYYYFRGFVLHREGKLQLALDRLMTSYKLFPREVNKDYELGNIYARMGDNPKAIWAYSEALKANAGYDEIYFNRGTLLAKAGDEQAALRDFLTSIYINPTNRAGYQHIMSAVFLRNPKMHAPLAIRVLEPALQFFPQDKDLLNNLASFYTQEGRRDRAAEIFVECLKIDPSFDIARRNLIGLILTAKQDGNESKAKEIWQLWSSRLGDVPALASFGLR